MKRIPQLDGIRGIAILLVVIWHYFPCQYSSRVGLLGWLCRCLSLTWSGVDLFFVLSGFLIAGILFDQRESSNYFKIFYIRRICRIFPLYFLTLGLFIFARQFDFSHKQEFQWLFDNPMPLGSYATFTQNIFMGARGTFGANWLGMTWSLAVEEQFYLFLPLVIYFLPRSTVFSVLVTIILMAPILRCASTTFDTFVGTPWRADSLLSGAGLAFLVRSPRFMETIERHKWPVIAVFMAMLLGVGVMSFRPASFGSFDHFWLAGFYSIFILISLTQSLSGLKSLLTHPILVWLGATSYGIYMFHQPVSGLLHGLIQGKPPGIESFFDAGITALALLITLVLAALSYHLFELPILRYGHSFRYIKGLPSGESKSTTCIGSSS
jgi:peptidoglycan/LPS O-acetylase OafA/YrhL